MSFGCVVSLIIGLFLVFVAIDEVFSNELSDRRWR